LDGESNSSFFTFIVGVMSIVPIALPVCIKVWLKLYGSLESRMVRAALPVHAAAVPAKPTCIDGNFAPPRGGLSHSCPAGCCSRPARPAHPSAARQ
jgi:hypothetical protein